MFIRSRKIEDLGVSEDIPTFGLERGRKNEERVEQALTFLKDQGEIEKFHQSWVSCELDQQGIDFLVWPEYNYIVPLQVKSSERGKEDHIAQYGKRIPCVVILDDDSIELIADKVMRALALSVEYLLPDSQ